jgi:uncharacterized membrane protein
LWGTPAPTIPGLFLKSICKYWAELAIIGVTIIALFIRLYNLTWQCFNVDEVYTAQVAANTTISTIYYSFRYDCNLPLYYLAAHWASVFAGTIDRFTVRIPAVIFGTLAIPVIYLIGKELQGKTFGLITAAVIAIMFPFYYYSQDGRAYSLVMLMFLGFIYFYIKIVEGDTRNRTLIFAGLFAALSLWSHYYSIVPIVVAILLLLINNRKLAAIEISVVFGLLVAPMLAFMDIKNLLSRAAPWIFGTSYTGGTIPAALTISPIQMILYLPNELWCWAWLVVLPLAAYTLWKYRLKIFGYFAIIGLASMAGVVVLAHFTNALPRYALLVSPLFILVALYPISKTIDNQKTMAKKIVFVGVVLFIIAILNIGSFVSWTTFNICPLVNNTWQLLPPG